MTPNIIFFALMFAILASCKSPEARRPVQQSSGTFIEASVERNKKLYEEEKTLIETLINKDTINSYIASDSGFWYVYNIKDTTSMVTPEFGDAVEFIYNVNELDGDVILSVEEIGIQNYKIDQSNQDLISGIRDGIKLMKAGETVTFLFPSYKAYGYYGIADKLEANVPVKSTVTLKSIEQSQEN